MNEVYAKRNRLERETRNTNRNDEAEKDDEEGEKIFKELSKEYLEKYMPAPNADPHGGIEDFVEHDKLNNCIPVQKNPKTSKSPNEDEMV